MADWKRITTGLAVLTLFAGGVAAGRYVEEDVLQVEDADVAAPPYDLEGSPSPGAEDDGGVVVPPIPVPDGSETTPERLADVVRPPDGEELYWGLYHPGVPYEEGALDERVDLLDRTPAIAMWFQEWAGGPPFPAGEAADLVERGIVPMITWEAWAPPPQDPSIAPTDVRDEARQPKYRLDVIARGEYDDYIRDYAEDVAAYGGPLMLRPFHEFDGFWFPWGGTANQNDPEDLVRAWRHVHDIFEDVGATNVTWVWNPNAQSVPDVPRNQIDNYWPGSEYVDWIGLSGFNFGTTSEVSSWRTFVEVYEDRMEDLEAYEKPIVIAEFAAPEQGGDKAEWIREAFETMQQRYPSVGAAVWFDRRVGEIRDWRVDSSQDALKVFRTVIADTDVLSAPAALRATRPGASEEGGAPRPTPMAPEEAPEPTATP